jgi:hypothetical protein
MEFPLESDSSAKTPRLERRGGLFNHEFVRQVAIVRIMRYGSSPKSIFSGA